MKQLIAFFIAVLMFSNLYAQPKLTNIDLAVVNQNIYRNALKYQDFSSATYALQTLVALYPNDVSYKDTLAQVYFTAGQPLQSVLCAKEVLQIQPKNTGMLYILASTYQTAGNAKEAIDNYEKLYTLKKEVNYLYQIAVLQYQLKRVGECETNLEAILKNTESEKNKINIVSPDGVPQEVSIKAAALNVKGFILKDAGKITEAKDLFEKALALEPNFLLAKGNLDSINNPKQKNKN
jgi:predicted Zn-dependent protease